MLLGNIAIQVCTGHKINNSGTGQNHAPVFRRSSRLRAFSPFSGLRRQPGLEQGRFDEDAKGTFPSLQIVDCKHIRVYAIIKIALHHVAQQREVTQIQQLEVSSAVAADRLLVADRSQMDLFHRWAADCEVLSTLVVDDEYFFPGVVFKNLVMFDEAEKFHDRIFAGERDS